jgi:hypothetical protein
MEDLVLCYDNTNAGAVEFAKQIHYSLLGILEVQCREPIPTDKTTFAPTANNLVVVISAGMIENPVVVATIEKAVQTKKTIIYVEDLLVGTKGVAEIHGMEDNVMKKLKDIPTIQYVLECSV